MIDYFLKSAFLLGQKSKCVSKKVGAIIAHDKRIISTGYNGTPPKFKNCNEVFDPLNFDREAHHEWSKMYEVHAEMNAILFAAKHGVALEDSEIYTILQPCDECLKNIVPTGIKKIYYVYPYEFSTSNNELWNFIEHEQVVDPYLLGWLLREMDAR